MKFELKMPDNKSVCLKNFIIKYKDVYGDYEHTLKNILIFNNIKFDENTSSVIIQLFKNNKMVTKTIPLTDIYNKHINFVHEFD